MVGMYTVSINIEYEFNKLVDDEFKISRDLCSLKCVDSIDYFYDRYQEEYVNTCDCISSMMTEMLNCSLYRYAVAHTSFFGEHDDKVKFTVYFPKERISELLCEIYERADIERLTNHSYVPTDSEIIEFFKLSVRHEIGHVIYNNSIIEKLGKEKAIKFFYEQIDNDIAQYNKVMEPIDIDEVSHNEYHTTSIRAYYDMEAEKEANKAANVDVERLIELELKVRFGINEQH